MQSRCHLSELTPAGEIARLVRQRLRELPVSREVGIHERVDLREWTDLRLGGPGDLLIRCGSLTALCEVLQLLASHGVGWLVIGGGSRLVAPEQGVRVPLLALTGELARWDLDLDGADAGAGVKLAQLAGAACRAGMSGMEAMVGAVGSLGGAVRAAVVGCPDPPAELLEWIELALPGQPPHRVGPSAGAGGRRWAAWSPRAVVVRARLRLCPDRPAAISERIASGGGASGRGRAGATARAFQNPVGSTAAGLLTEAGCLGLTCGGARLGEREANSITTARTASADDVLELLRRTRRLVADRCGVELEPALWFVDQLGSEVAV
jgi:UDP-N-acetylmuramate dehydrogenase